MFQIDCDPIY